MYQRSLLLVWVRSVAIENVVGVTPASALDLVVGMMAMVGDGFVEVLMTRVG